MTKRMNRRRFFRHLLGEALITVDECRGRPQLTLADIPKLPRPVLGGLVPVISPAVEIVVQGESVLAHGPGQDASLAICRLDQPQLDVFNLFDGQHTLDQIIRQTALAKSLSEGDAGEMVLDLFYHLVTNHVCLPRDPLPSDYEESGEHA